jgi:hypothetical protein
MPRARVPISFRQLCLVATEQLEANPGLLNDSDWKDVVKDRVHQLGFQTPRTEFVYRAMDATESAYLKRHPPPRRRQPSRVEHPSPHPAATRGPSLSPLRGEDQPELSRPLHTDPMVRLGSAIPPWLRDLMTKHANGSGS